MSKDRDFKASAYYYIRRGWHDHLMAACEKKGKDNLGITTYWKAYSTGSGGNVQECIRQLSNFHTRPDMQYPVSLALSYFHQKAQVIDHDVLSNIRGSLSVSEDVAVSLWNVYDSVVFILDYTFIIVERSGSCACSTILFNNR